MEGLLSEGSFNSELLREKLTGIQNWKLTNILGSKESETCLFDWKLIE